MKILEKILMFYKLGLKKYRITSKVLWYKSEIQRIEIFDKLIRSHILSHVKCNKKSEI